MKKEKSAENILFLKNALKRGDFISESFLSQFAGNGNREDFLLEFLKYKNKEYGILGLDASFAATLAYSMMYEDFLPEANIINSIWGKNLYEIKDVNGVYFSGDTLTSAWTSLKLYFNYIWLSPDCPEDFKKIFSPMVNDRQKIRAPYEENYPSMLSYLLDKSVNNKAFFQTLRSPLSDEAVNFLNMHITLGNFIAVPPCFNSPRSNYGIWDTTDRMLLKIYLYFKYKNEKYLAELFTKNIGSAVKSTLYWLKISEADSWEKFVKIHCFEPFISSSGVPLSLKTGKVISDFENDYLPMPESKAECEEFFKNANYAILKRGELLCNKIKQI